MFCRAWHSLRIIHAIIQLPVSQRVEKYRIIFELPSNGVPNYLRFRIVLREFGYQNVKTVIDSSASIRFQFNSVLANASSICFSDGDCRTLCSAKSWACG
jgi:hypothetical protein